MRTLYLLRQSPRVTSCQLPAKNPQTKRCAITGAAGYVGSAIRRRFAAEGWEVVELGRRKSSESALHIPFDLSKDDPDQLPWEGIDALVHCAYDFRLTRWEEILRVNVQGSVRLLQAAKSRGVGRGVFISSLSCFEGCRSLYGKAKLLIEAEALRLGLGVVRPGLVWGQSPGGMMGALMAVAAKSKLVPLIGDGSFPQYLVHEDDLAQIVFSICSQPAPARPLSAAHGQKNSLRSLLEGVALQHGRKPWFIPVPWQIILAGLRTLEFLRLPSHFRSDSLVGFVFQNPSPDFSLPELPQIKLRPFARP